MRFAMSDAIQMTKEVAETPSANIPTMKGTMPQPPLAHIPIAPLAKPMKMPTTPISSDQRVIFKSLEEIMAVYAASVSSG
jgi:hypothetical protein